MLDERDKGHGLEWERNRASLPESIFFYLFRTVEDLCYIICANVSRGQGQQADNLPHPHFLFPRHLDTSSSSINPEVADSGFENGNKYTCPLEKDRPNRA